MILRIIIPLLLSIVVNNSWAAPNVKAAKFNSVTQFNKIKLEIVDLMNVDSAVCVLAQDRVRRVEGGFELQGRAPGAPCVGASSDPPVVGASSQSRYPDDRSGSARGAERGDGA